MTPLFFATKPQWRTTQKMGIGTPAARNQYMSGMPDHPQTALQAAKQARLDDIRLVSVGIGESGIDQGFLNQLSTDTVSVKDSIDLAQALSNLLEKSFNSF